MAAPASGFVALLVKLLVEPVDRSPQESNARLIKAVGYQPE